MNSDILHPDVWMHDLTNRGYTVEETPNGPLTLIVVKLSGTEVGRQLASGREGIFMVRERLEGGESLLPCLTTAQRNGITFKTGHQIANSSTGNTVECWNGTSWESGSKVKTGTYTGDGETSQGITGVGFAPKWVKVWAPFGCAWLQTILR